MKKYLSKHDEDFVDYLFVVMTSFIFDKIKLRNGDKQLTDKEYDILCMDLLKGCISIYMDYLKSSIVLSDDEMQNIYNSLKPS